MNRLPRALVHILQALCLTIIFNTPAQAVQRVFFVIHGTFANDSTWHQPAPIGAAPSFFDTLKSSITSPNKTDVIVVRWSGRMGHENRVIAAQDLLKIAQRYPADTKFYIVAHSHGATVGIIFAKLLKTTLKSAVTHRIRRFYALGAPVDINRYMPDMDVIKSFYNFYSLADVIQPVFGLYQRIYPPHERIANLRITAVNGMEPNHPQLHDPAIAAWLVHIHKELATENLGNFENFDFQQHGTISFTTVAHPRYDVALNVRMLLARDAHFHQDLPLRFLLAHRTPQANHLPAIDPDELQHVCAEYLAECSDRALPAHMPATKHSVNGSTGLGHHFHIYDFCQTYLQFNPLVCTE